MSASFDFREMRCATCGSWDRRALDCGHCWSGDRLDDDFSSGPADITYPDARCETWWAGTFDPAVIIARGGDPERPWADAERERARQFREFVDKQSGNIA
jgi:hypothetical protein